MLANDTDPDGGPKLVASLTQPAHGTAAIAGSGLTYQPAADYCNDLGGGSPDTFTYTLNGGSTATVAVTVECVLVSRRLRLRPRRHLRRRLRAPATPRARCPSLSALRVKTCSSAPEFTTC